MSSLGFLSSRRQQMCCTTGKRPFPAALCKGVHPLNSSLGNLAGFGFGSRLV
eukprot:08891.XXX_559625_559780_1 [CDS] Oithona nana genome sequencing.